MAWLKINHPEAELSSAFSGSSSSSVISGDRSSKKAESSTSGQSQPSSSDILSDILVLPRPVAKSKSRCKPPLNAKTVCITDDEVLEDLKSKEAEKAEAEREKEAKKLEKEQRKKEKEQKRLETERRKKEREEKQQQKRKEREEREERQQQKRKERERMRAQTAKRTSRKATQERETRKQGTVSQGRKDDSPICQAFAEMQLSSAESSKSSEEEDDAVCPKCGLVYADIGGLWVCCDGCDRWYDVKCTNIKKKKVPELYYCDDCVG